MHTLRGMSEIGNWRLLEPRNGGAYGSVYRVEPLERPEAGSFALKLAHHRLDARFTREAHLLRRVKHPNVPRLHEEGLWEHPAGPFPYLVMDWVEGLALYDWGRWRRVSSREVMKVLAGLARALAATHEGEAVHRDVKGGNVLVRRGDGQPMLLDFGAGDYAGAPTLTREVLPPGTPGYRSPEALRYQWRYWQVPGARYEPGPADDLYALGVTGYRLVTRRYPPVPVPTEARGQMRGVPLVESEPAEKWVTVCRELAGILRQLLSKEPAERGSAAQVAEALEKAAREAGPQADEPIILKSPQWAKAARQGVRGRTGRGWVPWLLGAGGLAATAGLGTAVYVHVQGEAEQLPPKEELASVEREEGREDGGTSLAQEVLSVSACVEAPEPEPESFAVEMPKKPLPGQARPPCRQRDAVEIKGGCWVRSSVPPPCAEGEYEWEKRCYLPILGLPPPATSEPR